LNRINSVNSRYKKTIILREGKDTQNEEKSLNIKNKSVHSL